MANNKSKMPQSANTKVRQNTGNRGAKRRPMKPSDLVLMGKGQFQTIKSVDGPAWLGTSTIKQPYDAKQAELNILAGFC